MADGEKTFDEMSQELVALCQQGTLGLKQRSQGIGRFNGIFFRTRGLQTVQDTDPHSVWVSSNTFPDEVCCRIDGPKGKRVTFSRQSNAEFGLNREVGHDNTNVAQSPEIPAAVYARERRGVCAPWGLDHAHDRPTAPHGGNQSVAVLGRTGRKLAGDGLGERDAGTQRSILTVSDVVHPAAVHRQHLCRDPAGLKRKDVPGVRQTVSGSDAQAQRHCRHGPSPSAQGPRCARSDRGTRGETSISSQYSPPHRDAIQQA